MSYRLCAEWIPFMGAYRIFSPENPQDSIAYDNREIEDINNDLISRGFDGVILIDDSTHTESR